jgi:hypothetical protein
MATLTIRLSAEDEKILERRARRAKMTKASFVRELIRAYPFRTAQDVYEDAISRMGDSRLRISKK